MTTLTVVTLMLSVDLFYVKSRLIKEGFLVFVCMCVCVHVYA